jgi:aspartate racemase
MSGTAATGPWRRVIGIVGGMGPHAHMEFERRLLAAVEHPSSDQDYPEWVVSSVPQTPDRTLALLEGGPSPVPWMLRSLERLASCTDFAVVTCITAHAFLDEVRARVRLPILDIVELTLAEAVRRFGPTARVGILATTGALRGGVYRRAADRTAPGLHLVSLLDLPDGDALQEELLMRPIYGPLSEGRREPGGIKSGGDGDPRTRIRHRDTLAAAVRRLAGAGAVCVVTGCTEVPLALGREPVDGTPLLDPLDLAARAAVRIARGELPLP